MDKDKFPKDDPNDTLGKKALYAQGVKATDAQLAKGKDVTPSHLTDSVEVRRRGSRRIMKRIGTGVLATGMATIAAVGVSQAADRGVEVQKRLNSPDTPAATVPLGQQRTPAGPSVGEYVPGAGYTEPVGPGHTTTSTEAPTTTTPTTEAPTTTTTGYQVGGSGPVNNPNTPPSTLPVDN